MTREPGTSRVVDFAGEWTGQVVASSVHAGHGLRPEIAAAMVLDEEVRLREEDPHTDVIAGRVPAGWSPAGPGSRSTSTGLATRRSTAAPTTLGSGGLARSRCPPT